MRITVTLDDEVVELLMGIQKARGARLKTVVNEALRYGLGRMRSSAWRSRPFKTKIVDLGKCLVDNIDSVTKALAEAEVGI